MPAQLFALPARVRRVLWLAAAALAASGPAVMVGTPAGAATGPAPMHFAAPVFVDPTLAGGEPFVARTPKGTLVYTSHEGTTHLLADGVVAAPAGTVGTGSTYRNQVIIWTSDDNGASWHTVNFLAGFYVDPSKDTGFSDPDLTVDDGGRIYNTGIDLANDALFSSGDGGKTWDHGTVNCTPGDRPWLAGGKPGEVWLATDPVDGGHAVFHSTNSGDTCSGTGVPDYGSTSGGGSYTGFGKLYDDHGRDQLVEPLIYSDANGAVTGLGVSTMPRGASGFTPHLAVHTTLQAHWPSIAIDRAGTYYLVWDTDDRVPGTTGGCGGTLTPAANSIMMATSTDSGATWSSPVTVAHPGTRVLWPWVTAGDAGRAAVTWYAYDRVTDPDCGTGNVSVEAAHVTDATGAAPAITTTDVVGRPVHSGGICQGGTTCVATGQDRRLGDFFTDATDSDGCLLVATGDTTRTDPATGQQLATSRPLFIRQDGGPSLLAGSDCAPASVAGGPNPSVPEVGVPVLLPALGAVLAAGLVASRRRRTRPS